MLPSETNTKAPSVCVIGLGYVGLTLSVTLSEIGFSVVGVDRRQDVVTALLGGQSHFFEVGLETALQRELQRNLRFSTAVRPDADVYVISVGTPVGPDREPHLDDLRGAVEEVGKHIQLGNMVVLRSTVPVGTTRDLVLPLLEGASGLRAGQDFHLVFAPERTIEGRALAELRALPQIIGGLTPLCVEKASSFFVRMTPTVMRVSSLEAAEMVKIVNNTYRDVTFAFANEIALFCQKLNIDSHHVIHAANAGYERSRVPQPSPGVGGDCLSKDPYIFMSVARRLGLSPQIIPAARAVNTAMPNFITDRIAAFGSYAGVPIAGTNVLLLGIAFKGRPETSDVRSSPALDVARMLSVAGATVYGYDPRISADVMRQNGIIPVTHISDLVAPLLAVVIMNNHDGFADPAVLSSFLNQSTVRLLLDPWNMYTVEHMQKYPLMHYANMGFDTFSITR